MPTRRAEPVARRDRLTTRRAPTQRSAARTAKAVAIPPGRTAPRTRHHQAFIPRPAPGGTWPAPTSIVAARSRMPGQAPTTADRLHTPNAQNWGIWLPEALLSSRPATRPESALGVPAITLRCPPRSHFVTGHPARLAAARGTDPRHGSAYAESPR